MDTNLSSPEDIQERQSLPRTVYLALWFPLLSETFVFYEVEGLWKRKFPVSVVSLYGERSRFLAEHMRRSTIPVRHLGIPAILPIAAAVVRRFFRQPRQVGHILRTIVFHSWRDLEMRLENYWACCCGIYLAEQFRREGVQHVHGAWASGPATAAWVIHQLEGIPYSFTARATDVRPPDGFLAEKLADCSFARADSSFNVPHLASFLPEQQKDKVCLVYNTVTLPSSEQAPVHMKPPYRIIAIGRLIEKKGFLYLVRAAGLLRRQNVDVEVTIVGGGGQMHALRAEAEAWHIQDHVHFTGALPHDQIGGMLHQSDIMVMPSIVPEGTEKSDGLPTVIVEAMSMGVPVVSTNVASIGDVVKDGHTGLLVAQKDAAALAQAIRTLAEDRDKALELAANARNFIREMFSAENTLGRMQEFFCNNALPR